MIHTCEACGLRYNDAHCSTLCPHHRWLTAPEQERKDLALALLGRDLRWAHLPDGPTVRIQSVEWNGMITLVGWSGEFAPDLFRP